MPAKRPEFLTAVELRRAIVDLLSRRDYSRLELSRKFSKRCEDPAMLEDLLEDLQRRNWQSDERFAESFFNSRCDNGLGPMRLQQELRTKGISNDIIQLLFESVTLDWYQLACDVADKKNKSLKDSDPHKKQKLFRFLAYRGFDNDQIYHAIEHISS